jgi:hypothetical protein
VCALWFDRATDVPLAAEIVRDVLFGLSVVVDVVVVDLPRPDHEIFAAVAPPLR